MDNVFPISDLRTGSLQGNCIEAPETIKNQIVGLERRSRNAMKIYRMMAFALLSVLLSTAFAAVASADNQAVPGWDPALFQTASNQDHDYRTRRRGALV